MLLRNTTSEGEPNSRITVALFLIIVLGKPDNTFERIEGSQPSLGLKWQIIHPDEL